MPSTGAWRDPVDVSCEWNGGAGGAADEGGCTRRAASCINVGSMDPNISREGRNTDSP